MTCEENTGKKFLYNVARVKKGTRGQPGKLQTVTTMGQWGYIFQCLHCQRVVFIIKYSFK